MDAIQKILSHQVIGVEHIGIAVADLDEAQKIYTGLLGSAPYKYEDVESEDVRTVFYMAGPTKIELLASLSGSGPVARFLAKRGPGIHHIAFEVRDIYISMGELRQHGYEFTSENPSYGADSKLVCFIHPKSTGGTLIELCQEIVSEPKPGEGSQ